MISNGKPFRRIEGVEALSALRETLRKNGKRPRKPACARFAFAQEQVVSRPVLSGYFPRCGNQSRTAASPSNGS